MAILPIRILIFFVFLLGGCASNEKVDAVKNPLNYLNGENYNTNRGDLNTPLYVPVPFPGARINKVTSIKGHIYSNEGVVFAPLNHIKLILVDSKNKAILETSSGAGGAFEFSGRIPNGNYRILIEEKRYKGQVGLEVKSYDIKDLKLVAKTKP